MSDDLRRFDIQRMVKGEVKTLIVYARNLNDAKRMADEQMSGS